ncbi:hypothetical protein B0J14DRAFT_696095 [Halenospora varia]|nr:hypothetical protein B0J14DRAFT_696095 [Halenospora varia]
MATNTQYEAKDYTVGWICALPVELAASVELLDREHPQLPSDTNDTNSYSFGSIGEHKIVIGCPLVRWGLCLMVGIGGGVPSEDCDIRLGDVVVSKPHGQHGGVVQYDFGKKGPAGQFLQTGSLNSPPQVLLTALARLEADRMRDKINLSKHLSDLGSRLSKFAHPAALDNLYKSTYPHPGGSTCSKCKEDELVDREERSNTDVKIHYGTIASGKLVMKDGVERDKISGDLGGIMCFEMEAAGLMNNFPCLIIRGICDYADSHKNKKWQPYAAASAAAFAKELFNYMPAKEVEKTRTIEEAMSGSDARVAENTKVTTRVENKVLTAEEGRILDWLSSSNFSGPQNTAQRSQTTDTGKWLLSSKEYTEWRGSSASFLWLFGVAGCGKTVLCSTATQDLQTLCYSMLRYIIRQLSSSPLNPEISSLWNRHHKKGSNPSINELSETLIAILQDLQQDVFIVLDALDEYPQSDRKELLNVIDKLRADGKFHLLITSRKELDIQERIQPSATFSIDIEQSVKSDIKQFVQRVLAQDSELRRWDQDIKQRIEEKLTKGDETRFRWVDLQIKRLRDSHNEDELQEALDTVPETLEATYAEALKGIPKKNEGRVRNILMWLTSSYRQMTLDEIAATVSFRFAEDVLKVCSSLLITFIDEDTEKFVKLAHFSVKEYLVIRASEDNALLQYRFSSRLAHATIAKEAVSYFLDTENWTDSQEEQKTESLLKYYAEYWPVHTREINNSTEISDLQDYKETQLQLEAQINTLFCRDHSLSYEGWLQIHDPDDRYGHYDSNDSNDSDDSDDSDDNKEYPQPLYYAALLGLKENVKQKLIEGCRVGREGQHGSAFNAAAIAGYYQIFEILAENNLEAEGMIDLAYIIKSVRQDARKTIETVLHSVGTRQITKDVVKAAARNWYSGKEVMMVLLEQRGVDIITEEVVKAAAGNGASGKEVMMLLLEQRGVDIITEEVVKAAAGNRGPSAKEVMMLLLEQRGVDIITEEVVKAAAGNRGPSAKEVMMLLLEQQGADIVTEEVVLTHA